MQVYDFQNLRELIGLQAFALDDDAGLVSVDDGDAFLKALGLDQRFDVRFFFDGGSDGGDIGKRLLFGRIERSRIIYDALKPLYSYDITFEQFRNTQTDANGILTADKIGPSIAKDMTWNAIYSVLFSLIAIGLYITFRFKRWQWASGATAALAFNALLIIGIFSMFYGLLPFNLEVNQAFIAAILTIIGYAINDTVVVFDRIREYLGLYPKRNLKENVNNAINSTLSRTINTSGTTLVTLLAIFFFGGETIRGFIFALIIGVVVGTAATIFLATPIAYDLMTKRAKTDVEK